jgi:hypothetical protein
MMSEQARIEQAQRRAVRVLRMVHHLHKLGYQRVRIVPGLSPSGCHWRCSVTHIRNILKSNGAMPRDFHREMAHYTTGQKNAYFGWDDARQDTVEQLATRFIERFPDLVRQGRGLDWPYAGWYVQMLGFAEKGALPVAYADCFPRPDPSWLPTTKGADSGLPMPPGGEADPIASPDEPEV